MTGKTVQEKITMQATLQLDDNRPKLTPKHRKILGTGKIIVSGVHYYTEEQIVNFLKKIWPKK